MRHYLSKKQSSPRPETRYKEEQNFYEYYFKETSQIYNIPLENFFPPNSKLRRDLNKAQELKTVKKSFIKQLCLSGEFKKDLQSYLDERLLQEYQKARPHLLHVLILKMKNAKGKIKFKVPWSDEELIEAKESVMQIISSGRIADEFQQQSS